MDPLIDIKARLPIEELVGQYCQLKKKGKGFVCVCPFHNDTHPSMQVSPDKGIAYCFACSSGGDIFSFYQKIESVDFRQAVKDLAEKTGVKLEGFRTEPSIKKDEKERLREVLSAAKDFYYHHLKTSKLAQAYLKERAVTGELAKEFGIGVAPDSFSDTYQYLLKKGFSRKEIVDTSLGIQKDLQEGKIYDRFRHRLMFPIHDGNGELVGFGGRTLGEDDAKYINSGETALYNKSNVLYGLHLAKESIRLEKKVILVEGYFDVIACHRIGVKNVVAVSGTALTEQHVKTLKRYAERVILCLDQDAAGKQAAERAFLLCCEQELPVYAVTLTKKDPDEEALDDPDGLQKRFAEGGTPYLDLIMEGLHRTLDLTSSDGKRAALSQLMPLLNALQSSVEREHYLETIANLLGTTRLSLEEDLKAVDVTPVNRSEDIEDCEKRDGFSSAELAMGIILLFPTLKPLLEELIQPEDGFACALYEAIKEAPEAELTLESLTLEPLYRERASVLELYLEHQGFTEWSESLALKELKRNCTFANRDLLAKKKHSIAQKLKIARQEGNTAEEDRLMTQHEQVLKLARLAAK